MFCFVSGKYAMSKTTEILNSPKLVLLETLRLGDLHFNKEPGDSDVHGLHITL